MIYYNSKGIIDNSLNDETCFCKTNDTETVCYVRKVNVGINAGHFLNPDDMVGKSSFNVVSKNREFTSFVKVNNESFKNYLIFLKDGNIRRLRTAERENG